MSLAVAGRHEQGDRDRSPAVRSATLFVHKITGFGELPEFPCVLIA